MPDLSWPDAILEVLRKSPEPMHYTRIAEAVVAARLRSSYGATPAQSVNQAIRTSMKSDPSNTPFIQVGRGYYSARPSLVRSGPDVRAEATDDDETEESEEPGFVNAFGMFWERSGVDWERSAPRLLGRWLKHSTAVDFFGQRGVYLLHDRGQVVYVGRAIHQDLGTRLKQHTQTRLRGRWDRFSWFGLRRVAEGGTLDATLPTSVDPFALVATLEALLIEGLEPPQNRRRGDGFRALEFVQQMDPQAQAGVTK